MILIAGCNQYSGRVEIVDAEQVFFSGFHSGEKYTYSFQNVTYTLSLSESDGNCWLQAEEKTELEISPNNYGITRNYYVGTFLPDVETGLPFCTFTEQYRSAELSDKSAATLYLGLLSHNLTVGEITQEEYDSMYATVQNKQTIKINLGRTPATLLAAAAGDGTFLPEKLTVEKEHDFSNVLSCDGTITKQDVIKNGELLRTTHYNLSGSVVYEGYYNTSETGASYLSQYTAYYDSGHVKERGFFSLNAGGEGKVKEYSEEIFDKNQGIPMQEKVTCYRYGKISSVTLYEKGEALECTEYTDGNPSRIILYEDDAAVCSYLNAKGEVYCRSWDDSKGHSRKVEIYYPERTVTYERTIDNSDIFFNYDGSGRIEAIEERDTATHEPYAILSLSATGEIQQHEIYSSPGVLQKHIDYRMNYYTAGRLEKFYAGDGKNCIQIVGYDKNDQVLLHWEASHSDCTLHIIVDSEEIYIRETNTSDQTYCEHYWDVATFSHTHTKSYNANRNCIAYAVYAADGSEKLKHTASEGHCIWYCRIDEERPNQYYRFTEQNITTGLSMSTEYSISGKCTYVSFYGESNQLVVHNVFDQTGQLQITEFYDENGFLKSFWYYDRCGNLYLEVTRSEEAQDMRFVLKPDCIDVWESSEDDFFYRHQSFPYPT